MRRVLLGFFVLSFRLVVLYAAADIRPIRLEVDASDAPRNILHVKEIIPAKSGPFTLVYPKWIPGNHRPSGPIANLTGLHFAAAGKPIEWERDPVDMYAFHVNVPGGATEITATFDQLINSDSAGATGAAASSQLLDLNWNQVVLYPEGASSDAVQVLPSVKLAEGWKFGTALRGEHEVTGEIEFNPVSLTTLVDSPLIAGTQYRQIRLSENVPVHVIDMVGESNNSLQMSASDLAAYKDLVAETGVLFGARHYSHYDFLLTLSDEAGHHGVEHHQSSDNSAGERMLSDPRQHLIEAGLLPHEFTHSWNGCDL